jgi:hypothetical protein
MTPTHVRSFIQTELRLVLWDWRRGGCRDRCERGLMIKVGPCTRVACVGLPPWLASLEMPRISSRGVFYTLTGPVTRTRVLLDRSPACP